MPPSFYMRATKMTASNPCGQSDETNPDEGTSEERDGPSAAGSLEPSDKDDTTQSGVRSGSGVHLVMQDKSGRPGPGGSLADVLNGCTLQEGSGGSNRSGRMCSDVRRRRQRVLDIGKVNDRRDSFGEPL